MWTRLLLAIVVGTLVISSSGCGWRRGCSKCNVRSELPPLPAPSNYCPPPCP